MIIKTSRFSKIAFRCALLLSKNLRTEAEVEVGERRCECIKCCDNMIITKSSLRIRQAVYFVYEQC